MITFGLLMTRAWYVVDPEPDQDGQTGFMVVQYRKPRTKREILARQRRAEKRESELKAIMSDPVTAYQYERDMEIRRRMRRLEHDPKFGRYSQRELERYVTSYMGNAAEPLILKKLSSSSSAPHGNSANRQALKVERNAEEGNLSAPKAFTSDFIQRVKSTRQNRTNTDGTPMTQKDLAMLVNRHENIIKDFEKGELAFDSALKALLVWKLGLH